MFRLSSSTVRLAGNYCKTILFFIYYTNHSLYWVCACWNVLVILTANIIALYQFKPVRIGIKPGLINVIAFPNSNNLKSIKILVNFKIRQQNFNRYTSVCIQFKFHIASSLLKQLGSLKCSNDLVYNFTFDKWKGLKITKRQWFQLSCWKSIVAWLVHFNFSRFRVTLTIWVCLVES